MGLGSVVESISPGDRLPGPPPALRKRLKPQLPHLLSGASSGPSLLETRSFFMSLAHNWCSVMAAIKGKVVCISAMAVVPGQMAFLLSAVFFDRFRRLDPYREEAF